jgi:hypothetical protein
MPQQHGDSDAVNKIMNQELKRQNSCSACLTEGWHKDLWLHPNNFSPSLKSTDTLMKKVTCAPTWGFIHILLSIHLLTLCQLFWSKSIHFYFLVPH